MNLGMAVLITLLSGIITTILFSLLVIKRLQERDNRSVSNFFAAVIFIIGSLLFCVSFYVDDFIMNKVDESISFSTDFLLESFPDSIMFNKGYPQKDIDQFFSDLNDLRIEDGGIVGATVNLFIGKVTDNAIEKKDIIVSFLSDGETISFYTITDSFRENSKKVVDLICLIIRLVLAFLCFVYCLVVVICVIVTEKKKAKLNAE